MWCREFQSDSFLAHHLYPALKDLVSRMLGRVCTTSACKRWSSDTDYDVLDDVAAFLPFNKIIVSDDLKGHVSTKLTECQAVTVQKSIREHYKVC